MLKVEEVDLRDPGPGEVLVRMDAIGLNRADALFRAGDYYYRPTLPGSRVGYEAAGVVEATGADVTEFAPGDAVLSTGSFDFGVHGVHAERVVLPVSSVARRPEGTDAVTAAGLWLTYTTAYGGLLEVAGLKPGEHVLITAGSSGVGIAAIQTAARIGAVPIATTRTAAKRQQLLDAGAAEVVVTDGSDLVKEVKAITGGHGADVVFDAVGGPGFRTLGEAAVHAGRLVVYGWLDRRPIELPMNWPLTVHGYAVALQTTNTAAGKRRAEHFIASGLRGGTLRPVTGEVFDGLDRIGDAHRLMESNTHTGKIVVTVRH